ncbi:hypothetical protein [Geomonas propionica]|uniref:Uncharacterized protein n=1 Tax=Geomonas propionica TaxID=2798582 RepID=A0ABS0YT80_9BACT|nr:hypothetical protein [Geomonas propionica]MBJ6800957.1 hypothetical protein [Geomonas propionica]
MPHNNLPHPDMITKSEETRQILTPDLYAYMISLIPTPERYAELHKRFEDSVTGFFKGDPAMVKECEDARDELNKAWSVVHGVSKAVSPIDPTVQQKFGAAKHKASTNSPALTAAKDLKVQYDKNGRPHCSVSKLPGARGYDLWFCEEEPGIESNWNFFEWSSNCQGISLAGLNRTKTNYLKIRGKRGNTLGPWSNMVVLPPV